MESVLRALNHLLEARLIENYAIGGAIGASFYIEAMQTEDVDAFTVLPPDAGGLISLAPIYRKLISLGGVVEREYVRFDEWPLRILTDANALISEAIDSAIKVDFGVVSTRVFTAEHLCAIAIQTGRGKDLLRVNMFLEQNAVDRHALEGVLMRHTLTHCAANLLPTHFPQVG